MAALAGKAMDEVRSAEFKSRPTAVAQALGALDRSSRRSLSWAMRTHYASWNERHMQAMYSLQCTNLQSARAWRMKVALAQVYEAAANFFDEGTGPRLWFPCRFPLIKLGILRWTRRSSRTVILSPSATPIIRLAGIGTCAAGVSKVINSPKIRTCA